MTPLPRLLTRGWRAALFAAVVCLSPGRAAAECGDYVTIVNAPAGQNAAHSTPRSTGQTPEPHPMPVRLPCHGPNCSGSPTREFPPAPVPPTVTPAKELARLACESNGESAPGGGSFDRDPTSPRPIRRASSVFHPPRIG